MKDNQHKYQMVLVLAPKVEEVEKEKVFAKVEAWLDESQAKIVKKDNLGVKELVYEIAKLRKGDFWSFMVESPKPVKLQDLNLFLNRESNVIRYLILKNPVNIKPVKGK